MIVVVSEGGPSTDYYHTQHHHPLDAGVLQDHTQLSGPRGPKAIRRRRLWVYDQPTGALYQVSKAGSALGVAVGDGRRRRPAECVCVERQRLQRLQQPERRRLLRRRLLRLRKGRAGSVGG